MCSITRLTHRWFWFTSQVSRVPPHPANPAQQSGLSNPHQSSLVDSGSLSLLLSALQPVLQYVPFSCLYRFVPAVLPSILYCHCQSCRSKGLFYSILSYPDTDPCQMFIQYLHLWRYPRFNWESSGLSRGIGSLENTLIQAITTTTKIQLNLTISPRSPLCIMVLSCAQI